MEAGAPNESSGSLSATPVEATVVSSAGHVRWSGQVEGEVQRAASKVDELSWSFSSLQDDVATCSSQFSFLDITVQQLVGNHDARSEASRDAGDVRELTMQKWQLRDDAAFWKSNFSLRRWSRLVSVNLRLTSRPS